MPWNLKPPGTRKGNPYWIVRGKIPGGRKFEVSTRETDKGAAERFAATAYLRLSAGQGDPDRPCTWADAADLYVAARDPGKNDVTYIKRLKTTTLGTVPVGDVRIQHLVAAAAELYPDAMAATRNRQVIAPAAAVP